jgi:hypothetical protein
MINTLLFTTAHTLFYSPVFLRNTILRFDFYQNIFEFQMDCRETVPHKMQSMPYPWYKGESDVVARIQRANFIIIIIFTQNYCIISLWLDFLTKIPFTHPFKHSTFRIRTQSGLSLPGMFAIIWMDPWYTRHKMPCIALTPSNTKMGA